MHSGSQEAPVPCKRDVALQLRQGIDDGSQGAQRSHHDPKSPPSTVAGIILPYLVDALSVQSNDSDAEDELQKSKDEVENDERKGCGGGGAGRRSRFGVESFESHFCFCLGYGGEVGRKVSLSGDGEKNTWE